jgi:hypothetical protein
MVSKGRSSHRSANAETTAIPVGVVSSPEPPAKIFQPVASSNYRWYRYTEVAMYTLNASGSDRNALALMLWIWSAWRAADTPTMSAMESSAPTSWK